MDGFLVINKDKNITSQGVCSRLKRILNEKKIGHTGTLDPNTTGVLVVALGNATKLINYLPEKTKKYSATALFGTQTDSYDIYGNVIDSASVSNITEEKIDSALSFLKEQKTQMPPIYSAIKVDGKKLYEYARKGQSVEFAKRPIKIDRLVRTSKLYEVENKLYVDLDMTVSRGFYVRSLINDLGETLNSKATMSNLVRTSSGMFNIEESYTLKDVEENNYKLIPLSETLFDAEKLEFFSKNNKEHYLKKLIKNGIILDERQIQTDKLFFVYCDNELLAIYRPIDKFKYKPVVIF